jgi:hypothetical protein
LWPRRDRSINVAIQVFRCVGPWAVRLRQRLDATFAGLPSL